MTDMKVKMYGTQMKSNEVEQWTKWNEICALPVDI